MSIDPTPEAIEFRDRRLDATSVWLSSNAIAAMVEASIKAGRKETGGVLVGRYGSGWSLDIVEATPKPRGSLSGWFWFQRSATGLADLLRERWDEGLHYVGEWHLHPGGDPTPSGQDIRAMRKIAADQAYQCPAPVLVIIGGSAKAGWRISATLFRNGAEVYLQGPAEPSGSNA